MGPYALPAMQTQGWISWHMEVRFFTKPHTRGQSMTGEMFSGFLLPAIYFTTPYLLMFPNPVAELVYSEANEA